MADFSEAIYKMDKWANDDAQSEYYDILDNEETSREEKIEEMDEFLEILVQDWDRLNSYMDEEYSDIELATYIVDNCG